MTKLTINTDKEELVRSIMRLCTEKGEPVEVLIDAREYVTHVSEQSKIHVKKSWSMPKGTKVRVSTIN